MQFDNESSIRRALSAAGQGKPEGFGQSKADGAANCAIGLAFGLFPLPVLHMRKESDLPRPFPRARGVSFPQ